jgi:ribosome-binding factor A
MSSRRLLKAGEAIREVVSMAILTELRDPRVKNVTVIGVEVAPDMREAKVLVSIMGSESQQATSLRGLKNSAGFLQSKIAERIDTRYTPKLTFVADDGVKKSLAVAQILEQLALEKQKNDQARALGQDSDATLDEQDDETDDLDEELEDAADDEGIESDSESELHAEGYVDQSLETKPADDPMR